MMGRWPMAVASLLYFAQALYYLNLSAVEHRGMAITFFAYALANVGLIWDYLVKSGYWQ